jgi:hypothetical protein
MDVNRASLTDAEFDLLTALSVSHVASKSLRQNEGLDALVGYGLAMWITRSLAIGRRAPLFQFCRITPEGTALVRQQNQTPRAAGD